MNISSDTLQLIFWSLFFGFIFYYVIFRAPAANMIFSAETDEEIDDMKNYLEDNGIKTYTKNRTKYRYITLAFPWTPSLHVLNAEDKDRALQLIYHKSRNR